MVDFMIATERAKRDRTMDDACGRVAHIRSAPSAASACHNRVMAAIREQHCQPYRLLQTPTFR
jgi:hypothetical protein